MPCKSFAEALAQAVARARCSGPCCSGALTLILIAIPRQDLPRVYFWLDDTLEGRLGVTLVKQASCSSPAPVIYSSLLFWN